MPGCIRVTAMDAESDQQRAVERKTFDTAAEGQWTLAVFRGDDWSQTLRIQVESFEAASCEGPPLESAQSEPFFVGTDIKRWEVTLSALDADGDGYAAAAAGGRGSDCDDGRADVHPGAPEACGGEDTDCDGAIGCTDADCQERPCDDQDPCTELDRCVSAGCEGTPRVCDAPPAGGCHQRAGTCAQGTCDYAQMDAGTPCPFMGDAGVCTSLGLCAPPDVEFDCADGVTNDGDNLVDCEDVLDCPAGIPCNDADACTLLDVCQPNESCAGAPLDCGPATDCATPACVAGACMLNPKSGACSDNRSCTAGDMCDATNGMCVGGTNLCSAPPSCHAPVGQCLADGGCEYAVAPGASCSDGVPQTFGDTCLSDAGCEGTSYVCPPSSSPCKGGPEYDGDGGCGYPPTSGACTAMGMLPGLCFDGGCISTSVYPYVPANFVAGDITPAGNVTLSCAATYDVSTKAFTSAGCTFPVTARDVTMSDGSEATVLAVSDLVIDSNGSLELIASSAGASRPIILAVYGDADLSGPIDARSSRAAGTMGAGANPAQCGNGTGGPGNVGGDKGSGGGGGGYGSAGGAGGATDNGGVAGGIAGVAVVPSAAPLRGGCPGGQGGGPGGAGGHGGGALQLSVAGVLTLNNFVTVSGAGGVKGPNGNPEDHGGGGGGSGGALVLEANELELTSNAKLTANGGGGGGGNKNSEGTNSSGADGSPDASAQAAGGGKAGGSSTVGGAGASSAGVAGSALGGNEGSGGGGGGVGAIFIRHESTAVTCINQASVKSPALIAVGCAP